MKKTLSMVLSTLLILSLLLTGCSSQPAATDPNSDADKEYTLQLGHNSSTDSITDKALMNWAKTVSNKTDGKLNIVIYPQNQLGTNKELSEQTALGSLDMNVQGLAAYVEYGVEQGFLSKVPFLFKNMDAAKQFWNGSDGDKFKKQVEERGVKVLSTNIERMPREFASKEVPLYEPEDTKGLKIRAGDTATNQTLKILGAVPTSVALNEMYTAVSQGVVDVIELPLDYIYNYSMYEVTEYLTLSHHTYDLQWLVVNKEAFEKLPADYQKILMDTIPMMEEENNKAMVEEFDKILKQLEEKGMTIIEIDRSKWEALVPQVVPELEKTWPSTKGYFEKIMSIK